MKFGTNSLVGSLLVVATTLLYQAGLSLPAPATEYADITTVGSVQVDQSFTANVDSYIEHAFSFLGLVIPEGLRIKITLAKYDSLQRIYQKAFRKKRSESSPSKPPEKETLVPVPAFYDWETGTIFISDFFANKYIVTQMVLSYCLQYYSEEMLKSVAQKMENSRSVLSEGVQDFDLFWYEIMGEEEERPTIKSKPGIVETRLTFIILTPGVQVSQDFVENIDYILASMYLLVGVGFSDFKQTVIIVSNKEEGGYDSEFHWMVLKETHADESHVTLQALQHFVRLYPRQLVFFLAGTALSQQENPMGQVLAAWKSGLVGFVLANLEPWASLAPDIAIINYLPFLGILI